MGSGSLALGKGGSIGLTNNQLKIIAMLSMLADHIGYQLFPWTVWLRVVGRLAFPIFAFMIAEGCRYTRNRTRYFCHLAGLAVGCQLVYGFFTGSLYMSILVTFSLSVLVIFAADSFLKKRSPASGVLMAAAVTGVLFITLAAPVIFRKYGFDLDYGIYGVLLPPIVYYARGKKWQIAGVSLLLAIRCIILGSAIQWFSLLAVPLLALYNGKRGKWKLKYMFYIFYPAHLALVYLIGELFF